MQKFANGFLICGALACAAAISAEVSETHFVLQRAARIPGAKLNSGRYTVRILDRLPDRYILEIVNDAHPKAATTILAIPDENFPRLADGAPTYWSNGAKTPSIRGLWIPGASSGAEFVFPKAEAAALAKQVRQPVPAIDPDSEGKKAVAKMSEPDRQIVTLWLLSAVAVTPEGAQTEIKAAKFVPVTPGSKGTSDVAGAAVQNPRPMEIRSNTPITSDSYTKPATTLVARANTPSHSRQRAASSDADPKTASVASVPIKMPKTAGTFATNLTVGLLLTVAGVFTLLSRKNQNAE